jgi:uncharacterized protein YkwD
MKALRTIALATVLMATYPSSGMATPADDPPDRMIAAINEARSDHGLPPLRAAPKLAGTASRFARTVIRTDDFSHGASFRSAGFRTSGEIMSFNRGWAKRPGPAIRLWLRSSGHRSLMLSPSFRYVGAGIARGRFGGPFTTIWIVHFGAH